ncbi:zinc ribbon-containing protein [Balneatrix alpica]|uniref:zinc ribbon-containing protein n=1 Tax=Balneatrix alpica TaxID=75684 RepID=UPI00273964CF|nr:zinc ribbon-containing protein [Balneatrix alpica]
MSEQQQRDQARVKGYQRMLARLHASLDTLEQRSWQAINQALEDAAKLELAAEELTREEVDLLKAWISRDLRALGREAIETQEDLKAWLRFDLDLLEQQMADWLLGLADPTLVEWVELQHRLQHGEETYMQGEVASPGTFTCSHCGHMLCLTSAAVLQPCHICQGHYFARITRLEDA